MTWRTPARYVILYSGTLVFVTTLWYAALGDMQVDFGRVVYGSLILVGMVFLGCVGLENKREGEE